MSDPFKDLPMIPSTIEEALAIHRQIESDTAERIAAWLEKECDECDTEAATWVGVTRDHARSIREGEWKR